MDYLEMIYKKLRWGNERNKRQRKIKSEEKKDVEILRY